MQVSKLDLIHVVGFLQSYETISHDMPMLFKGQDGFQVPCQIVFPMQTSVTICMQTHFTAHPVPCSLFTMEGVVIKSCNLHN